MFLTVIAALSMGGFAVGRDPCTPVPVDNSWWYNRHNAIVQRVKKGDVDLVFIGDSITHAFAGEPFTGDNFENRGKDTWDIFYADRKAVNLGISGDKTQNVLWRLENGEMDGISPKVVVVMIGTNNVGSNTPAEIAQGVEAICTKAKVKAPHAKVLLLGIFPRAEAKSPARKAVIDTNVILEAWAKKNGTTYLDIGKAFLDEKGEIPSQVMPDGLHPFAYGYRKWAMAMEPTLAKLLNTKPKTVKKPTNSALVPVEHNRDYPSYDFPTRHKAVMSLVAERKPDLVFIGDSITHAFGGPPLDEHFSRGKHVWAAYYGNRNAIDMGFGWDRTENVLWRIENGELDNMSPKAVVLLIGTNNLEMNTEEEIRQGIEAVTEAIHAKLPKTQLVLLGILPRGQQANDPLRQKAGRVNKLIADLGSRKNTTYLDLGGNFVSKDGSIAADVMFDFLHPTEAGYRILASELEPTIKKVLAEKG